MQCTVRHLRFAVKADSAARLSANHRASAATHHRPAFTLLEVLFAAALIGAVAAALYGSLHVAVTARSSTLNRLDAGRAARFTLDALGRDLPAALPPAGILAGPFVGTDQRSPGGADADTLSLHLAKPAGDQTPGDVRQVSYQLSDDGLLVRHERSDLLAVLADEPQETVLCRGVVSLNMRYFDGAQWLDAWDSTARENTLPTAVEVVLELVPPDQPDAAPRKWTRLYVIPCGTVVPPDVESGEVIAP